VLVPDYSISYVCTHVKLSSFFYLSQLVDIFPYEILLPSHSSRSKVQYLNPVTSLVDNDFLDDSEFNKFTNSSILVYNFHSLGGQDRFYFFTLSTGLCGSNFNSVSDLFFSANWLEREASELHGLSFCFKKDVRNLMLQYGDSSLPFQKSFPSLGLTEVFYNPIKDTLINSPISIQL
jgi:NADH:ubiquinone oxidoreductase subunit C